MDTDPDDLAAAAPEPTSAAPTGGDDERILDGLEADLTAVEHAIETLDRVTSDGVGGEQAAAQIQAAVSAERFGQPGVQAPPTA